MVNRRSKEEREQRARDRAKNTIIGLISASGGELVGRTRLHLSFYFAHLNYLRISGLELTAYPIVKMAHGPGMESLKELLAELRNEGKLRDYLDSKMNRVYVALQPEPEMDSEKSQAISQAIQFVEKMSDEELNDGSFSRSWRESERGDRLSVSLDNLSDEDIATKRQEAKELIQKLGF